MPQISIHDIALDSVLAEPIVDLAGRTILPSGTRLTPTIVRRLELWSVASVSVEGPTRAQASPPVPVENKPTPAANETERDEFPWTADFQPHRENPQMQLIERALDTWYTRHRSEGSRA